MADRELGFCEHCGARVSPGTAVCPQCGQPTGSVQNQNSQTQQNTVVINDIQRSFNKRVAVFMLAIYAGFTIIPSIITLLDAQFYVDIYKSFYGASQWMSTLSDAGMSTEAEYINYLLVTAETKFLSGIFALIALLLVVTKKHCMYAVISCAIGSVVLLGILMFTTSAMFTADLLYALAQCAVGLLVARIIYTLKDSFES